MTRNALLSPQTCPVCRKPVSEALAVFMPVTKDFVNTGGSCGVTPICSPSSEVSDTEFPDADPSSPVAADAPDVAVVRDAVMVRL